MPCQGQGQGQGHGYGEVGGRAGCLGCDFRVAGGPAGRVWHGKAFRKLDLAHCGVAEDGHGERGGLDRLCAGDVDEILDSAAARRLPGVGVGADRGAEFVAR